MKCKRFTGLLLVLVICISLLSGLTLRAEAQSVSYVTGSNGHIYNWGKRGETATFLSPNAEAFYRDNGIGYAYLAGLSGSTSQSSVPSSALYGALQKLMQDTHTSYTNYADTRPLYAFTDCQESNGSTLTCLYCNAKKSSRWDYGETWQREHTWPKSKSLNGNTAFDQYGYNDETDIMMLRPACPGCNSDRSNTAYGTASGYFYPNLNSAVDVRGDVARIMLYGYVRWGNTGYMWGSSGVIQDMDVLLSWIEADPVDTWEMGRNDAVESINGNRNVFVDFPELAFLLFGRQIPSDMSTPSGSVACEHEDVAYVPATEATCSQSGNTEGYYCNDCESFFGGYTVIDPLDHNWENVVCIGGRICSVCGLKDTTPILSLVASPVTAQAYKLGMDKQDGAVLYFNGSVEFASVNYRLGTTTDIAAAADVYLEAASGGYRLYFMNGSQKTYIRVYQRTSGSAGNGKGSLALVTTAPSEIMTFDTGAKTLVYRYDSNNAYYVGTYSTYTTFSVSNTSYITGSNASKLDVSQYPARFYQAATAAGHSWSTATCTAPKTCAACGLTEGEPLDHSWSAWEQTQAATCTQDGQKQRSCTGCGMVHTEIVTASGHSFENFLCTACGYFDEGSKVEAMDMSGDGRLSVFDAQILAEAKVGKRQLSDSQWAVLDHVTLADIIDYVLGIFSRNQ